MGKPNFSAELPEATLRQIEELKPLFNGNKTQIVIQAIRLLHQQEKQNMQTETLTIGKLETNPERDPYTSGISKTTLKLDPIDREVWVVQEYNDNATPVDEWNGLILTWPIHVHPTESEMSNWINDNMARLTTICDNFERHWNGNNHVGRYTSDEARAIYEAIEFEFDNDAGPRNGYEVWDVEQWMESQMSEITADTTDDQLEDMAAASEPDKYTVVTGDILDYITQHRDNLKAEQDDNDE